MSGPAFGGSLAHPRLADAARGADLDWSVGALPAAE